MTNDSCAASPHRSGSTVGPTADGELLTIVNAAGLELDGVAFLPTACHLAVVHVHGSLGNFYQQRFLRVFAREMTRHGVALLSFNLTAHDGISEGYYPKGEMRYVGGSISEFGTCFDDIDAMLTYARTICPEIVLQGHSLGCDRVLHYVQLRRPGIPLVLLSPCDSFRLQEEWLANEAVDDQIARLDAQSPSADTTRLLPESDYGVSGADGWTYRIPINRSALLSIIRGPVFELLRVSGEAPKVSDSPAFVYLGAVDSIRGVAIDDMMNHVRKLLPASRFSVHKSGDHSLGNCEMSVAKALLDWIGDVRLERTQRRGENDMSNPADGLWKEKRE